MSDVEGQLRRLGVRFEKLESNLQLVLEGVGEIKKNAAKLPVIEEDVAELKYDMRAVKAAIRDTNIQVDDQEQRLSKLERQTA